jgi:hypothetical protein
MIKEQILLGTNNSEKDPIKLGIKVHCDIFEYVHYLYQECVHASGNMKGLLSVNIIDKIKQIQHSQSLLELYQAVFNSSKSPIFESLCELLSMRNLNHGNHKREVENQRDKKFWLDFKPILISKFIEFAKKSVEKSRAEFQKQSEILKQTLENCNQNLADLKEAQGYELFKEKIINWLSSYDCLTNKQFQQKFRACPSHFIIRFVIDEYYKKHTQKNSGTAYLNKNDSSFAKLIEQQRQNPEISIKCNDNNNLNKDNTTKNRILTVKGHHVLLSEVINLVKAEKINDIAEYRIFVTGTLYLDEDLTINGTNVNFQAKVVDCVAPIVIDTSGRNADSIMEKKAKSGQQRRACANIPNGDHGENGRHGAAGESAGNIQILAASAILHPENLTIIASGGNGADGQNGGDGDFGRTGEPGVDGIVENIREEFCSRFKYRYALATNTTSAAGKNLSHHDKVRPTNGRWGGQGGNGGNAGLGGAKGLAGEIYIADKCTVYYDNRNTQKDSDSKAKVASPISVFCEDGIPGNDAKPGDGGKGGKDGKHGVDIGYAVYGYIFWKDSQKAGEEKRGRLTVKYKRGLLFEYPVISIDKTVAQIEQECKIYRAGLQGKKAEEIQDQRNETVQKERINTVNLMAIEQDIGINLSRGIEINNLEREITQLSEQQVQLEKSQQHLSTLLEKLEVISQEIAVATQCQTRESSETIGTQLCSFKGKTEANVSEKSVKVKCFQNGIKSSLNSNAESKAQDKIGLPKNNFKTLFSKAVTKVSELKKKKNISHQDEIEVTLEKLEIDFENSSNALPASISADDYTAIFKSLKALSEEGLNEILTHEKFNRLLDYCSVINLTTQQCQLISTCCKQLITQNTKDKTVLIKILNKILVQFRECLYHEVKMNYGEKIAEKTQVLILQAESLMKISDSISLNLIRCALYNHIHYVNCQLDQDVLLSCFDKIIAAFELVEKVYNTFKNSSQAHTLESCYETLSLSLDYLSKSSIHGCLDLIYIEMIIGLRSAYGAENQMGIEQETLEKKVIQKIEYAINNEPYKLTEQVLWLNLLTLEPEDIDILRTAIIKRLDDMPADSSVRSQLLQCWSGVKECYSREYHTKLLAKIEGALDNRLLTSSLLYEDRQAIKATVSQLMVEIQQLLEDEELSFSFTDRIKYYDQICKALSSQAVDIVLSVTKVCESIGVEESKLLTTVCNSFNVVIQYAAVCFDQDPTVINLLGFWSKLVDNAKDMPKYDDVMACLLTKLSQYITSHSMRVNEVTELSNTIDKLREFFSIQKNSKVIARIAKIQRLLNYQAIVAVSSSVVENKNQYEQSQKSWLELKEQFLQNCWRVLSNSSYLKDNVQSILLHINNNLEKYAHSFNPKNISAIKGFSTLSESDRNNNVSIQKDDNACQKLLSYLVEQCVKQRSISSAHIRVWDVMICSYYNQSLPLHRLRRYLSDNQETIDLTLVLDLTSEAISPWIILDTKNYLEKLTIIEDILSKAMFPSRLQENVYEKLKKIATKLNNIIPQAKDPDIKEQFTQIHKHITVAIASIESPQQGFCPNQNETDRICALSVLIENKLNEKMNVLLSSRLATLKKQFFAKFIFGMQEIVKHTIDEISTSDCENYEEKLSNIIDKLVLQAAFGTDTVSILEQSTDTFDMNAASETSIELNFILLSLVYPKIIKNANLEKLKALIYKLTAFKGKINKKVMSTDLTNFCSASISELARNITLRFLAIKKSQSTESYDVTMDNRINALRSITNFVFYYPGSFEEYIIIIDAIDKPSFILKYQKNNPEIFEFVLNKLICHLFAKFVWSADKNSLTSNILHAFTHLFGSDSIPLKESVILFDKLSKILEAISLDYRTIVSILELCVKSRNKNIEASTARQLELILLHKLIESFNKTFNLSDLDTQILTRILNSNEALQSINSLVEIFNQPPEFEETTNKIHEYFVSENKNKEIGQLKKFLTEKEQSILAQIIALNPKKFEDERLRNKLLLSSPNAWENILHEQLLQNIYSQLLRLLGISLGDLNIQASALLNQEINLALAELINNYDDYNFNNEDINLLLSPLQKCINVAKDEASIKKYVEFKNHLSIIITFKKRFNSAKFFMKSAEDNSLWLQFMVLLIRKLTQTTKICVAFNDMSYINSLLFYAQHLNNLKLLLPYLEAIPYENWLTHILVEKLSENIVAFIRKSEVDQSLHEELYNKFRKSFHGNISANISILSILIEKLSSENKLIESKSKITPNELLDVIMMLSENDINLSDTLLEQLRDKSLLVWKRYIREAQIRSKLSPYGFESAYLDDCVFLLVNIEDKVGFTFTACFYEAISSSSSINQDEVICLLKKAYQASSFLDEKSITLTLKGTSLEIWGIIIDALKKRVFEKPNRTAAEIAQLMRGKESNQSIAHLLSDATDNPILVESIENIKLAKKQRVPLLKATDHTEISLQFVSKPISEWLEQDIQDWSKYVKDNCENKDYFNSNRSAVLAIIARAAKLVYGNKPYDTQYAALLIYLDAKDQQKSRLGQIATGQGKSLIITMYATMLALTGEKVDIVTSSNILAERDAEKAQKLFDLFNIKGTNNCDEACRKNINARKQRYENHQVIYGDISSFQRDMLLTDFYRSEVLHNRKADVVIVDEVDSMMLDKSENVLYLSHDIPELKYLHNLYLFIWNFTPPIY